MIHNEDGDKANEQLFSSYTEAGNEHSVRRRWIVIVIGIGVALCIVAGLVGAERFLRSGPYDDMVSRLKPGMTVNIVTEELGKPINQYLVKLNGEDSMMYRVDGTDLPLIVQFRDDAYGNIIERWCVFVPEKSQPAAAHLDTKLVCHDVQ